MKKKTQPEPETIRFQNGLAEPPMYTITNLSLADIQALNAGRVPDWLIETTDFYLSVYSPADQLKGANELLRKGRAVV